MAEAGGSYGHVVEVNHDRLLNDSANLLHPPVEFKAFWSHSSRSKADRQKLKTGWRGTKWQQRRQPKRHWRSSSLYQLLF
jgi:hypothetical protein